MLLRVFRGSEHEQETLGVIGSNRKYSTTDLTTEYTEVTLSHIILVNTSSPYPPLDLLGNSPRPGCRKLSTPTASIAATTSSSPAKTINEEMAGGVDGIVVRVRSWVGLGWVGLIKL